MRLQGSNRWSPARQGAAWVRAITVCLLGCPALAAAAGAQTTRAERRGPGPCPTPARDYWKPDGRAGDLEFDVPAGWRQTLDQGFQALEPAGQGPTQFTQIGFLPAQTLTTDLRSYFEGVWAQWRAQMNTLDNGEPETTRNPNGFDVVSRYSRIYNPRLGNGTFRFAVAHLGNRVQAYWFVDNTGNIDYEEAFRGFEHSVQFAGAEEAAAPEPGAACGLEGLYTGFTTTAGYRNGIVAEGIMKVRVLVFLPDGNVMRELPAQGLANFDFGAELKRARDQCGRYRVLGNQLRITWSDGTVEDGERSGADLRIGGWSYVRAADADNASLEGVYHVDRGTYAIQFAPDGRFRENGILSSVSYSLPNKAPGAGTYRIRQHTLELHYTDGRVIPVSFYTFADDAGPRPKLIHLNSVDFVLAR